MKSQILIWTLLGARGVLAGVYHGVMHMETRCITYLSKFLVPVSSPGQSNGRLTGPSSLQDIAGNSSVSVIQTESQSALRTVVASGTTEVSTSSGFESLSVESQLTQVQPGSETSITTEKITSTSSAVLESTFSTVSLITSTGIIESTGRIVIFLIREPTRNTQKRSFNRRQNTDKRFVGNGNPDTCTYAESFSLAQEQLFIDGVPFFYNGQDYTELRARPVPPVGAVTRIFITSGRLLEIRNPDVPDGAGFCLARDGTVYVTFTSGPASCVPIILEVYDQRQSQNGRLVGLDTTTGAAETATSTSKAISSRSSTNIEGATMMTIRTTTTKTKTTAKDTSTAESSHESATESSSISQYQSVAPISEPTTSSKASTAESSSASTSSSFTTGITTSETSTEPNVSSPVPRESSTEGVSLTTALTSTSAVSTSSETEESTSIKPASSETSEAGTTSSEESTSSVEPETSTVESTTAASESETTTVQSATSTESTTSETSTSESNTLQSSTLQSTSSESTTNRPSTTIAQTTSNSPTTTTLGATPTNADECTALSNPYIASNGDRFDLSCSSNVVFLSGGGSEQADLVDCLEDCSTDPGCEGVQYTKANQNCVFLVQKVGTVPNNAYDVAFRG